jgi:CDP-glucose 4,6-dehydratase
VATLIEEMQKTWKNCVWRQDPAGSGLMKEANLLKLNCDKAYHRLGWEATLGFEETIRMTAEWYQKHSPQSPDLPALGELTRRQIQDYCRLAEQRGQPWAARK